MEVQDAKGYLLNFPHPGKNPQISCRISLIQVVALQLGADAWTAPSLLIEERSIPYGKIGFLYPAYWIGTRFSGVPWSSIGLTNEVHWRCVFSASITNGNLCGYAISHDHHTVALNRLSANFCCFVTVRKHYLRLFIMFTFSLKHKPINCFFVTMRRCLGKLENVNISKVRHRWSQMCRTEVLVDDHHGLCCTTAAALPSTSRMSDLKHR